MKIGDLFTVPAVNALVNAGVSYGYDMLTGGHGAAVNVFGYQMGGQMFAAALNGATAYFGEMIKGSLMALVPASGRAGAIESAILGPLGNGFTTFVVHAGKFYIPGWPVDQYGVLSLRDAAAEGFNSLAVHAVATQVTKVGLPMLTGRPAQGL